MESVSQIDDLPEVLRLVAEATSFACAMKLAQACGGTRVYIPARPKEHHWLVKLLGQSDATRVAEALVPAQSGMDILIPMGSHASLAAKHRRAACLIDNGHSKRETARAVGLHQRSVERLAARMGQNANQDDLFNR